MNILSSSAIDADEAVSILTLAFANDPAVRWMYPGSRQYHLWFPKFVRAFGGRAFAHDSAFAVEGGAALWLPPGVGPDEDAVIALLQESVSEERQEGIFSIFEQMGRFHPDEPHWYLPLIGVEPLSQGVGRGTALMKEALERCDGLPAYLESTNERNIPFYRRLGFEPLGVIRAGDSPPIIPMRRN